MFSKPTKTPLTQFLQQYFPNVTMSDVSPLTGSSGNSFKLETMQGSFNLRCLSSERIPDLSLHRYQKILRRLIPEIGPKPYMLRDGWLVTHWVEGDILSDIPSNRTITALINQVHHQPLLGWPVPLKSLLEYYWQQSDPRRKNLIWWRMYKRFMQRKLPKPLRLAPLHMDIHAGNVVQTEKGLTLIDWEYAGDGDIALELAAICVSNALDKKIFLRHYAEFAMINAHQLIQQVSRWERWVMLLMASWYEYRFYQTSEQQFASLANNMWRKIK